MAYGPVAVSSGSNSTSGNVEELFNFLAQSGLYIDEDGDLAQKETESE